ncbi:MAG: dipeptidase PepE [Bacteroidia bacterium]
MNLLLLSNSTNFGESYMDWCAEIIGNFVKGLEGEIIFIPYAAVGFSYEQYTEMVNKALSPFQVEVKDISAFEDPKKAIEQASAIFIGGGNTFQLTKCLQDFGLVELIKEKVERGAPYVGWSAGSNVAGESIKTTNDMPIVEPSSFNALGLIQHQINPHFTEATIPNHGGESRGQRLQEFLALNKQSKVICLPEASYCIQQGDQLLYRGDKEGQIMSDFGITPLKDGDNIQ